MWFISVENTIECVVIALFSAAGLFFASPKVFGALQTVGYDEGRLFSWSAKKNNLLWNRLTLLMLCCAASSCVLALCFSFAEEYAAVISLAGFVIFFVLYGVADNRSAIGCAPEKCPRLTRLECTAFVVYAIVSYIVVTLLNFAADVYENEIFDLLKYVPFAVMPELLLPMAALSSVIIKAYEVPRDRALKKKAKEIALEGDVTVIYVYGSYGRHTLQGMLAAFLSKKHTVKILPECKNGLDAAEFMTSARVSTGDVLIFGVAGRSARDVKALADVCPPDCTALVNVRPVNEQSGIEAELLRRTKKKVYFSAGCGEYSSAAACEVEICLNFSDVTDSPDTVNFNLLLDGEAIPVSAALCGGDREQFITTAADMARDMGLTKADIVGAIGEFVPVRHCLETIKAGDVTFLDCGMCSSLQAASVARDAAMLFEGRRIVVTAGLIVDGVLSAEDNAKMGKMLAFADRLVLVGGTLVSCVKKAYVAAGGKDENAEVFPSFKKAREYLLSELKGGDMVLLLNEFEGEEEFFSKISGRFEHG
ncbi:MAG: hypothetical protein LUD29_03975 [Clostridia bacterium]|nr:hypothetical protein [Clostridia bacterium]